MKQANNNCKKKEEQKKANKHIIYFQNQMFMPDISHLQNMRNNNTKNKEIDENVEFKKLKAISALSSFQ